MHLFFGFGFKTKLQFISSLILFFSSLFWNAAESRCVQRERERKHGEIKKGRVCMRAHRAVRARMGACTDGCMHVHGILSARTYLCTHLSVHALLRARTLECTRKRKLYSNFLFLRAKFVSWPLEGSIFFQIKT